jgi:fructose-1,6-bisphosphatase/inositol monophosphatase family enzyme
MTAPTLLPVSASGAIAIEVARRCARAGAEIALARFRAVNTVGVKGRGDVVTDADLAVEQAITTILGAEYPEHKILSEETLAATDASTGWTWVVDPIDGTKNYSVGIPFWCINIALCREGEPALGLTYDAVHGEEFSAEAGGGAFCDGAPIHASTRPDVDSSVMGVDLGYSDQLGSEQIALIGRIFPNVQSVRILGSAALALAYAASGRLDLFTHTNVSPWDIAAGILLVREAGGAFSERSGAPGSIRSRAFVAGGRLVHDDFLARYA